MSSIHMQENDLYRVQMEETLSRSTEFLQVLVEATLNSEQMAQTISDSYPHPVII